MRTGAETAKLLGWAGGLSIAAGVVHGLLAEDHFLEWWGYGVFFVLASLAQGLYGFYLLVSPVVSGVPFTRVFAPRQRRVFYAAGIAGHLSVVAMYLVTRTVGIPFLGPAAGQTEDWDALGLATKGFEVAAAVLLALAYARSRHARPEPAREDPAPAA